MFYAVMMPEMLCNTSAQQSRIQFLQGLISAFYPTATTIFDYLGLRFKPWGITFLPGGMVLDGNVSENSLIKLSSLVLFSLQTLYNHIFNW